LIYFQNTNKQTLFGNVPQDNVAIFVIINKDERIKETLGYYILPTCNYIYRFLLLLALPLLGFRKPVCMCWESLRRILAVGLF
jgi:hypothetical protein